MKKLRKPIKCHITAGLTHYEQSQGEGKVIASVTSISNDTYDFECGLKDLQMGTCIFFSVKASVFLSSNGLMQFCRYPKIFLSQKILSSLKLESPRCKCFICHRRQYQ